MATRNRRTVPWKIWVPADLALRFERRYIDPVTKKPQYAARSHILTALMYEFDEAVNRTEQDNPAIIRDVVARLIREGEERVARENASLGVTS